MEKKGSKRVTMPKDRDPVLGLKDTVDRAKAEIRRFVIDDPDFLPKNTTPLGDILSAVEVLRHGDYIDRLIAVQVAIGMPVDVARGLLGDKEDQKSLRACMIHGLTRNEKPAILLNADNIIGDSTSPPNLTFIEQMLLEELAHSYSARVELGPLPRLPKVSVNYLPMHNTGELNRFISETARPMYGIRSIYNPNAISVRRQGCMLMYTETVMREDKKKQVIYPSPPSSAALEELRASLVQNIFMAKTIARNTPGGIHTQVVRGLQSMFQSGWLTSSRGYNRQSIGAAIIAKPLMDIEKLKDPDASFRKMLEFLHDCDFEQLSKSIFGAQEHFNTALNSFTDSDVE